MGISQCFHLYKDKGSLRVVSSDVPITAMKTMLAEAIVTASA